MFFAQITGSSRTVLILVEKPILLFEHGVSMVVPAGVQVLLLYFLVAVASQLKFLVKRFKLFAMSEEHVPLVMGVLLLETFKHSGCPSKAMYVPLAHGSQEVAHLRVWMVGNIICRARI